MKLQVTTIVTSSQGYPRRMVYSKYLLRTKRWVLRILGTRDRDISKNLIDLVLGFFETLKAPRSRRKMSRIESMIDDCHYDVKGRSKINNKSIMNLLHQI